MSIFDLFRGFMKECMKGNVNSVEEYILKKRNTELEARVKDLENRLEKKESEIKELWTDRSKWMRIGDNADSFYTLLKDINRE